MHFYVWFRVNAALQITSIPLCFFIIQILDWSDFTTKN